MVDPAPVTVLTGLLGAGTTTLLNHPLRQPALAGTAVRDDLSRALPDLPSRVAAGDVPLVVTGDVLPAFNHAAAEA